MQPYVLMPATGSDHVQEWIKLGVTAHSENKLADAERHYRNALRLDPSNAVATMNLAVLFAQANNLNEALLTIERASLLDGQFPLVHLNRGLISLEADRVDEAVAETQKAMEMAPGKQTRLALAMALTTAGRADEAMPQYAKILEEDPRHAVAGVNSCFVQTLTAATAEETQALRRKWWENNRYTGQKEPHPRGEKKETLRVGYVSGDFKTHSAAMIFGSVVLNHDPKRVLPFLYSTLPVSPTVDLMTKKFMEAAGDRWREIAALTDEQVEDVVRKDGIDILVDLAGHTNGGRLMLFTRKPAPVQVSAWGFAHGTGCPEIDYFFADPVAVPETERKFYAEKVYDLPCVVSYLAPAHYELKRSSPLPYHRNGHVTFGSYARFEKLSEQCLQTYNKILNRVPMSRLQFKDHAFRRPSAIRRVREAMKGITPERLLFSISTSHPEHLLAHQQADLILDPFPHGGGVVSLEQLYMGVPIVTLRGNQPAGRTTSSLLTQLGREDWIAETPDEYVEMAIGLVEDKARLAEARETLSDEFLTSPVVTGYRESVEAAYVRMWEDHCRG